MPSPDGRTPADRVLASGVRAASPFDLAAVFLSGNAEDAETHEEAARALLTRYGINMLGNLGRADLQQLTGLSEYESLRVLCALELGRRAGLSAKGETKKIANAKDVFKVFSYLQDERKEHFCTLLLDSKNGIIGVRTIHIGTVNMSIVGPREVFREAVREGAVSVIVVHNHPSGNPEPSEEDINITCRLATLGDMLDIPVLDHVIIGHHGYVSLKERKIL